jgi:hypothetical protein
MRVYGTWLLLHYNLLLNNTYLIWASLTILQVSDGALLFKGVPSSSVAWAQGQLRKDRLPDEGRHRPHRA